MHTGFPTNNHETPHIEIGPPYCFQYVLQIPQPLFLLAKSRSNLTQCLMFQIFIVGVAGHLKTHSFCFL